MICTCKNCKTNFFPATAVSTDPSATSAAPSPAPLLCPVCGSNDIGVRQGWPELHYLVDLLAKGEIREAKAVYYNTEPEKSPELLDVVGHINSLLSSIPREISDKYFMEINAISVLLLDYCNGRYYENQKHRGVPKIETTGRKIWMKLLSLEQKLEHGIPGAGEVIMPWAYDGQGETASTAAGNTDTEESAPDAEGSVPDEAEVSALAEKLHCDPDYARSMLMFVNKASQKPEKAKKQVLSPEQYKAALDFLSKSKYDTTTHMGLLLAEMWIDAEDNLGGFSRENLKTVLKTERAARAAEREIKLEWLPGVESAFRRIMPPISVPYPEIYYSNAYNFRETRDSILKKVGCKLKGQPEDSSLEYIHGENGGAILIRIDQLPKGMTQNHFAHFFWHELGHFYAINADEHNLERFNDPDRPPKEKNVKFKQRGYWFWAEFIAEAICNHVSYSVRFNEPTYHPENIVWTVDVWSPVLQRLQGLLDGMFYGSKIDEYSLAHYFATLLKDTDTVLFVKAAEEGKLIQYGHDTPAPAGTIDATCIDELDEPFQPIMIELKGWLEKQLSKDQFWIIDEAGIEWLGRRIYAMDKVWREPGE